MPRSGAAGGIDSRNANIAPSAFASRCDVPLSAASRARSTSNRRALRPRSGTSVRFAALPKWRPVARVDGPVDGIDRWACCSKRRIRSATLPCAGRQSAGSWRRPIGRSAGLPNTAGVGGRPATSPKRTCKGKSRSRDEVALVASEPAPVPIPLPRMPVSPLLRSARCSGNNESSVSGDPTNVAGVSDARARWRSLTGVSTGRVISKSSMMSP